jgi:hypothetical protein
MKIGLSYSRCIRDIFDGVVDIKDVLVIIARTDFDPTNDEQWKGIWDGYGGGQTMGSPWSNPEWIDYPAEDEEEFRKITLELYNTGRMHQPRQFGAHPKRLPYIWLEAGLPNKEMDRNPAVKKAWQQFQIVAGLSDAKLVNDDF